MTRRAAVTPVKRRSATGLNGDQDLVAVESPLSVTLRSASDAREHAMGIDGRTHDLLMLSFHTRLHPEQKCSSCGTLVLSALALDGVRLCSHCYELGYQELGGGG